MNGWLESDPVAARTQAMAQQNQLAAAERIAAIGETASEID